MNDATTPKPGRKTTRQNPRRRPTITEPETIYEFRKGRSLDTIRIGIRDYEGTPIIDLRTWYDEQGRFQPGRGLSCHIRHAPRLLTGLKLAVDRLIALALITGAEE